MSLRFLLPSSVLGSSLGGLLPFGSYLWCQFCSPLGTLFWSGFLVEPIFFGLGHDFIVSVLLGRLGCCSIPMFLDMCLAYAFCSLVSTLLLDGGPSGFAMVNALQSKVVAPYDGFPSMLYGCMQLCNSVLFCSFTHGSLDYRLVCLFL